MHKTILVICYWRFRQKKFYWSAHPNFLIVVYYCISSCLSHARDKNVMFLMDHCSFLDTLKSRFLLIFAWGQTWGLFFIAHIESAERRFQLIWKIWNRLRTFREKRDNYWISEFGVLLVSPRVCVNIRGCAMQRTCTFFKHDAQEVFFINIITKLG